MSKTMNDHNQMNLLLSAIFASDSILLFAHISPDGDTLGSAIALKLRLESIHKQVVLILDGDIPTYLDFLPSDGIVKPENAPDPSLFDLAIAVDVSCSDRMGGGEAIFKRTKMTAQIDHHQTNDGYAQINFIDGYAPATAVLIYRMLMDQEQTPTLQESICLYTALSTDTGNFIYESTNAECFEMMAGLMRSGLPLAKYSRILFREKEHTFVRLLGKALPSLHMFAGGAGAGLRLSQSDMEQIDAQAGHTDGLIDYAIDVVGVKVAYFVRETPEGKVKASLRAIAPYRVDEAAMRFGGGGHRLAAGCGLDMTLDDAQAAIEKALIEAYRSIEV